MECRVVDGTGATEATLDRELLAAKLAAGFFWLDLHGPTDDELELLGEALGFHPLALEDSRAFGQRPKLEDYDDHVFLVVYGHAPDDDSLVEVHCYYSERYLVTVRRDPAPALEELHRSYAKGRALREPALVLYVVLDALVDSFFPALSTFDERLDLIEDDLIRNPKQEHLVDIFTMKRRLSGIRSVLAPQRDLVGRIASGAIELPAMTRTAERYFRDVYDHLIRLNEQIETTGSLMTVAVDVYLSAGSNRMSAIMKQLAVIASIFLPLSFITGFFGQNFAWMVEHVGGALPFFLLGIGTQLVALAILLAYFRRRGWF